MLVKEARLKNLRTVELHMYRERQDSRTESRSVFARGHGWGEGGCRGAWRNCFRPGTLLYLVGGLGTQLCLFCTEHRELKAKGWILPCVNYTLIQKENQSNWYRWLSKVLLTLLKLHRFGEIVCQNVTTYESLSVDCCEGLCLPHRLPKWATKEVGWRVLPCVKDECGLRNLWMLSKTTLNPVDVTKAQQMRCVVPHVPAAVTPV